MTITDEPLFGCQIQACAGEVSYPADMLAVFEGRPICQGCYESECWLTEDAPDFNDLPPFVPAYQRRIEAAEARAREEGAKAMQTKAVEVAAWSHMVPPDGGSPSEDECAVARAAADAIAALDPAQIAAQEPKP